MSSLPLSSPAGARPRLSARLLQQFRTSIAREAERRAVAQMDAHLRRDVGLPAPPAAAATLPGLLGQGW